MATSSLIGRRAFLLPPSAPHINRHFNLLHFVLPQPLLTTPTETLHPPPLLDLVYSVLLVHSLLLPTPPMRRLIVVVLPELWVPRVMHVTTSLRD
jgi:hypothetical protein